MSKTKILYLIIFILIFSTCSIFAQNPSQLFQQALLKENGEGDLKAAVEIYQKIVDDTSADRLLRAKSQLHIGMCWEKMGKQEAISAYKVIMEKFNDQSSIVQEARERLDKLDVISKSNQITIQPTYKKLADINGWFNQTDCSPDGRWIITDAFRNNKSELWLINLETLQKKQLTNVEGSFVQWAPSGNLLFYPSTDNEPDKGGLWILPIDPKSGEIEGKPSLIPTKCRLKFYDRHPEDNKVVFTGIRADRWLLGILDIEKMLVEILEESKLPIFNPRWAKNGFVIYYFSPKGIARFDLNTKEKQIISQGALIDITPDGNYAAILNTNDSENILRLLSLKNGKQVKIQLREGRIQWNRASFSHDGENLIIPSWHEYYSVNSVNLKTCVIESVSDQKGGFSQPVVSPLEDILLYQEWLPAKNTLHIRNLKDNTEELIPLHESFSRPTWSPNGRLIAYKRYGSKKQGISFFDTKIKEIIAGPDHKKVSWNRINWSDDSKKISYIIEEEGQKVLYIADMNSSNQKITSTQGNISAADWYDHDKKLVYSLKENNETKIVSIQVTNCQTEILVQTDLMLTAPTISPDQQWLAVFGNKIGEKNGQFYICPITGGELQPIGPSEHSYIEEDFVFWLPDSKHITALIYEKSGTSTHLHVLNINGSEDRITTMGDQRLKLEYSISPDGLIAYYDAMIWTDGILSEVDISEAIEKLH